MNEKLMEMSREAHSFAHKTKGSSYDNPEYDDAFAQKFSELIVQECADVCQQVTNNGMFDGNQQYASAYCRDEIKRYFGVE